MTAVLVVAVLAACGDDDDADPTATTSAGDAPTATLASGAGTTGGTPAGSGQLTVPGAGTPLAAQNQAPPRTVGELADRVAAAWPAVTSYRSVTTQGPTDAPPVELPVPPDVATPVPLGAVPESSQAYVDEVVMPDRRHQLASQGGQVSEFIAAGGRVYVRGRFAQVTIRPDLDPATWVDLDPSRISPDSPIGFFMAGFADPASPAFASPLRDLLPDTRTRELTPVGEIEIEGRICQSYQWVETTSDGAAMTRTIAIGADNLPCLIELEAGGYVSRTTYSGYNEPIRIEAPAGAVPVGQTGIMPGQEASPAAGTDAVAPTPATPAP